MNGSTTTISSTNLNAEIVHIPVVQIKCRWWFDCSRRFKRRNCSLYHDTTSNRCPPLQTSEHESNPLESVVTVKELGDNDGPIEGDKEYGVGEMSK